MAEPATLLPAPPASPVRLVTGRPPGTLPPPFGEPTAVQRVSLVDLQRIRDPRGDLVVAELDRHVPFLVQRMYALVDVPEGAERGGHAHRELEQVLCVLSGGLELVVDDGERRQSLYLDARTRAVYLRPMVWRELRRFRPNTVCVVLASLPYDEADYLRDYDAFRDALTERGLGAPGPARPSAAPTRGPGREPASLYPVDVRSGALGSIAR